ncbi:MAG: glycosyltransferase family 4 protein [Bacteroidales bacterium]|nr:glycosyltransferase family 4 protein [Bacteroidales bacterium]
MKIAYICNYIGSEFITSHCQKQKLTVSGIFKSHAIASALCMAGNEVVIYSPATVNCNKFITSFTETIHFDHKATAKVVYPHIFSFRKMSILNSITLRKKIKKELKKEKFDAVIFYNINSNSYFNIKPFNKLIKILEYEDNIFNVSTQSPSKLNNFINVLCYKKVVKNIDGAIIVGKNMLAHYSNLKKVLIPGVVSNVVLENINFQPKKRILPDKIKLVLAGGTHYSKGADLLMQALNYINYPCELIFYGAGSIDNGLKNYMSELPKQHKVKHLGLKPHDEMIRIMSNNADILMNTTKSMGVPPQTAGFPFKMLEYAATGRPIVSSQIGKLNDDFNKYIVYYESESPKAIADAINYTINNYESCIQNASRLQDYVLKNYKIENISKKLNEFINNLK